MENNLKNACFALRCTSENYGDYISDYRIITIGERRVLQKYIKDNVFESLVGVEGNHMFVYDTNEKYNTCFYDMMKEFSGCNYYMFYL